MMDYKDAVHKFQTFHLWSDAAKAEIVEAVVNEAVRRTMELVSGRKEEPYASLPTKLAKARARVAELQGVIEGLREWAEKLGEYNPPEFVRTQYNRGWDEATSLRMREILDRLPAKEASDVTT